MINCRMSEGHGNYFIAKQGATGFSGVATFDANRECVDPNRPIGEDEIEIVAVQAAFSREITAVN
jgi:hypothetical protein